MATVEVVSATSAFHAEKVEDVKTTTEAAAATVEEVVVAPAPAPAEPEVAKETETTTPTAVVSDESGAATNVEAPAVEEVKATEEEVKLESIPKEAVEEENKPKEEVVAPTEAPVADNVSEAPVEIEPEAEPAAETEAKIEAEVAKEDVVAGTNDQEEKTTEEVEAAPAVAEVEEEIKKTEE